MTNITYFNLYDTEFNLVPGTFSPIADYTVLCTTLLGLFLVIILFLLQKNRPEKKYLKLYLSAMLLTVIGMIFFYLYWRFKIEWLFIPAGLFFLIHLLFIGWFIIRTGFMKRLIYAGIILITIGALPIFLKVPFYFRVPFFVLSFGMSMVGYITVIRYMSIKIDKFQILFFIFVTALSLSSYFHLFRVIEAPGELYFFLAYLHLGMLFFTMMLFLINDKVLFKVRQRILLSVSILSFIGVMFFGWWYFKMQIAFSLNEPLANLDEKTINISFRHHLLFSEPIVLLFFLILVFFILYTFQQIKNLKRLDELNHLNRKLFNSTGIPLLMIGDGRIQNVNQEAVNQFGYSAGELKKTKPKILFQDTASYEKQVDLLDHQESVSFETDCRNKDRSLFRASVNLSRFSEHGRTYHILVIKNISDIIRNLQATELLNLVFNSLLSADSWQDSFPEINKLLEVYFSCNSFYIYLLTYEGFFEHGVLNAQEDRKTREFYIKSDLPFFAEVSDDNFLILSRISTPTQQYGFILFKIPLHIYNELAESTIKNISKIIAEVIETDTLLKELDNSEKTYRTLVDHSFSGIYLMQENRIFIANAKFYEITGYSSEDVERGIDPSFLIHPDSIVEVEANFNNRGAIHEKQGAFYTFKGIKKDKTVRWFSAYESIIEYRHKPAILAHLMDITAQIEMEQQKEKMTALMIQQQKMETLKNLVGGISHEYNNIFAIIKGYTELLLYSVASPDIRNVEEDLSNITYAVERGIKITNRMHVFARHEQITKRPLDLQDFFNSLDPVFQNMVRKKHSSISLKLTAENGKLHLHTDEVGLEEILYNLLRNSIDAVSENGVITINASQPDPNRIRIDITDNGAGISPEDLPNIFDPFFTTKDPQQATGLGLYIVFELTKALDAEIGVDSKPDEGTTVSLIFKL